MIPESTSDSLPSTEFAATVASSALGSPVVKVHRFTTGSSHFVFEVTCTSGQQAVVRATLESNRAAMVGNAALYHLLHPLGVPLPKILSENLDHRFPYLVLERLAGSDLAHVIHGLGDAALKDIAGEVARAQAITATTPTNGRYGYAIEPHSAPFETWSLVLDANLARSRQRFAATGLFELDVVEQVAKLISHAREELNTFAATPFLHDTTTKNVIVTSSGSFSGIVDIDDLCFGDPRYVVALTEAALSAFGGSHHYTRHWLNLAQHKDDRIYHLYVSLFLVDFMSEYGQIFNGNQQALSPEMRQHLLDIFATSLRKAS
ncbi:MAG: aminoglycoside phosphotransferase family protein [Aestuariivirga sp.]